MHVNDVWILKNWGRGEEEWLMNGGTGIGRIGEVMTSGKREAQREKQDTEKERKRERDIKKERWKEKGTSKYLS